MASLPYTRVVNVTLTRQDNFPTIAGFGIPLIFSPIVSDVTAGAVDATTFTKVYGSLEEVAVDWGTATAAYITAQDIFQQDITPAQIKIGYVDPTAITAGLNLLQQFDDAWFWGLPASAAAAAWHDVAADMTEFMDWFEAQDKILGILSTDANTENVADTTSVAYVAQNGNYANTFVAYHDDATEATSLHAVAAAYGAIRNFDDANSRYTLKFKNFNGVAVVGKGSAVIQAVTGFVPGTGLDATQGRYANTYVDIGGADFFTEGTMADGGFIDEKHFEYWIIARVQEEVLGLFLNNASVPYTDIGFDMVAQAVQAVLSRALTAGTITPYTNTAGDEVN